MASTLGPLTEGQIDPLTNSYQATTQTNYSSPLNSLPEHNNSKTNGVQGTFSNLTYNPSLDLNVSLSISVESDSESLCLPSSNGSKFCAVDESKKRNVYLKELPKGSNHRNTCRMLMKGKGCTDRASSLPKMNG